MLTGGCTCGAIRYEAVGEPFNPTVCHCSDCRRIAAAPFVAWFTVAASGFRFSLGTPRRFASSAKVVRSFCSDCGTPLTFESRDHLSEVDVTTCSLDHPELATPRDHIWTAGRLPWIYLVDGLPAYPGPRP